jgi:hypothetical protein
MTRRSLGAVSRVVKAEPRKNYRLWLQFDDGTQGEVDLSDLVGKGVFQRWKDPEEFAKVFVDPVTRTVAWPGEIDLCPDSLLSSLEKRWPSVYPM